MRTTLGLWLLVAVAGLHRLACEAAVTCAQCAALGSQPVCAGGQTFANYCFAQCSGNTLYTFGACGFGTGVQRIGSYYPYNTVNNRVGANCICPADYQPVCAGGQTFSNACQASCNGYTQYTLGACAAGNFFNRINYPNINLPYYYGGLGSRSGGNFNFYNKFPYYNTALGSRSAGSIFNRNYYPYNLPYYSRGHGSSGGSCICPATPSYVCAFSSVRNSQDTYLNMCYVTCLGATVLRQGSC